MPDRVEMETEICTECGIRHGLPVEYIRHRRMDKKTFYCPNGHAQAYVKSSLAIAQEENAKAVLELQARLNEAQHVRLVAEKAADAATRKLRKVEKRIAAGVCPCCNRTFDDLHRHMKTKHPTYALPEPAKQLTTVDRKTA